MVKTAGVKFRNNDKIYLFDTGELDVRISDKVIVETERGIGMGTVMKSANHEDVSSLDKPLKKIVRKADQKDIDLDLKNREKEKEIYQIGLTEIEKCGLPMKLVKVEYQFDGSKIIFYFTAENRVDFRELVKRLAQRFRIRIEMRQIGVRNETKIVGGIGNCGREFCCSTFLKDFEPVSVRIAKDQNLALNPAKISGVCGRLMCCLTFEHEAYVNIKKNMPKCGESVVVPQGTGKVTGQNIMERKVTIELEDGKVVKVPINEIIEERMKKKPKKKN